MSTSSLARERDLPQTSPLTLREELDKNRRTTDILIMMNVFSTNIDGIRDIHPSVQGSASETELRRALVRNMLHEVNRLATRFPELSQHPYTAVVEIRAGKVVGLYTSNTILQLNMGSPREFLEKLGKPDERYIFVNMSAQTSTTAPPFFELSPVSTRPARDGTAPPNVDENPSGLALDMLYLASEDPVSTVAELTAQLVSDLNLEYSSEKVDTPIHYRDHLQQTGRSCVMFTALNAVRALSVEPPLTEGAFLRDTFGANAAGEYSTAHWYQYFWYHHRDKYLIHPVLTLVEIVRELERGAVVMLLDPLNSYHAILVSGFSSDGNGSCIFRVNDSLHRQPMLFRPDQLARYMASGMEWVVETTARYYAGNRSKAISKALEMRSGSMSESVGFHTAYSLSMRQPDELNIRLVDQPILDVRVTSHNLDVSPSSLEVHIPSSPESSAVAPSVGKFPPRRRRTDVNTVDAPQAQPEKPQPDSQKPVLITIDGRVADTAEFYRAVLVMTRKREGEMVSMTERLQALGKLTAASRQALERWLEWQES